MDATKLVGHLDSPAIHRAILGDFKGPYSLGVGKDPVSSEATLVLTVPSGTFQIFPERVAVGGEPVPVIVQRDFRPPVPLKGKI